MKRAWSRACVSLLPAALDGACGNGHLAARLLAAAGLLAMALCRGRCVVLQIEN